MSELNDLFLNDINYNQTEKVFEWVNQTSTNSLYVTTYCNKPYTIQLDYAVDNNFEIIYTETYNITSKHHEMPLSVYKRFVRLSILDIVPPVNLKCQAFFRPTSVVSTQPQGQVQKVTNTGLSYGAFGSLSTFQPVPKRQYIFTTGTNGTINPRTFAIPYSDINEYDSLGNGTINFVNGVIQLTGFNVPEKAYITGSSYKYRAGQGIQSLFTGCFFQGAKDAGGNFSSKQVIGMGNMDALNNINNGLFFGYWDDSLPYHPDNFGILYVNDTVQTFIPRTQWNMDRADGQTSSLFIDDWSKLNVFKSDIQYLGAGNLRMYIEDRNTGNFVQIHEFKLPGTQTLKSSFSEPSFGLVMYQEITTSIPLATTDYIGSASYGLFLEGREMLPIDRFSVNSSKTGISGEANILTLRCDAVWIGKKCYNSIDVDLISASVSGTKPAILRIYRNCIINTPTWFGSYQTYINSSYDTTGTFGGLGSGFLLYTFDLSKEGSLIENLSDLHTHLNPDDTLTLTCQSTANTDVNISFSYYSK